MKGLFSRFVSAPRGHGEFGYFDFSEGVLRVGKLDDNGEPKVRLQFEMGGVLGEMDLEYDAAMEIRRSLNVVIGWVESERAQ